MKNAQIENERLEDKYVVEEITTLKDNIQINKVVHNIIENLALDEKMNI